ncbi:serine/threonine-protein kinase [Nocardia sp. NBC_00511]|uniref:serine/threonine-protein kinase n=1 Tax=Nocardia sp. NBC_00511 TaxID=2903591 RepID=UPI0030DFA342
MGQALRAGEVFAGYRIERLLGTGGMGEVYLARDRSLPRPVALKVLGTAVSGDLDVRARFQREADLAARLSHPNIVTVYDRGESDERLWIAMEYVEGTDAGHVVRSGPLAAEQAVAIVSAVAQALDYAHGAGVLHRDVKPANVMLANGPHARVLLADFGIAKALDESVSLTRTGDIYASLQYAAPEQLAGNAQVDRRADVYSLGCTLFHLFTGELPYPGVNSAQLLHGHLYLPVPLPSRRNLALPRGFDQVIARALAKDPEDRFPTCGALADAAKLAPSQQVPVPSAVRARRWPWVAAAIAGLALAGSAVAAAVTLLHFSPSAPSPELTNDAAVQTACSYARVVSTYDIKSAADFDTYARAITTGATGDWLQHWNDASANLRDTLVNVQAHSEVRDAQCALKSADSGQVQVSAYVTTAVTNTTTPNARTSVLQIILAMRQVEGRWLCNAVNSAMPDATATPSAVTSTPSVQPK